MVRVISCPFNRKRDISPVQQEGYLDLVSAFRDGVVPTGINVREGVEGDCKESDALLPPPSDVFDSIQQVHSVRAAEDALNKSDE